MWCICMAPCLASCVLDDEAFAKTVYMGPMLHTCRVAVLVTRYPHNELILASLLVAVVRSFSTSPPTVSPGAVVGIIGGNGAGKSTLFRMIMKQQVCRF